MPYTIVTPAGFDTKAYGQVIQLSVPFGPSITFVEKGLHITSIKFADQTGNEHDIIVGSDDPAHYVDEKAFRHGLVGRYVNLLPAEIPLQLPCGESMILPSFPSKGGSLHGGPSPFGWDEKILSNVELDRANLFSANETEYLKANSAGIWSLISPDGEGGHIGTVYCEIAIVALGPTSPEELGQIIIIYRAKIMDKPSTALNLTHHWGFNLGASSIAKGHPTPANDIAIQDHILTLKSKEILNIDPATSRPTGTTLSLSTPSAVLKDFRSGKTIGKVGHGYPKGTGQLGQGSPADGYCDYWIFDRQARSVVFEESRKDEYNVFDDIADDEDDIASFFSPESGVGISFTSNQPGMQGWSGNMDTYDGSDARKTIHGGKSTRDQGDGYLNEVSGAAFAMEFHGIYGAWMHPDLEKKGWNTILKQGEVYNNWVRMSIHSR